MFTHPPGKPYTCLRRRRKRSPCDDQALFDASVLPRGAGEYDERRSYIRVIII